MSRKTLFGISLVLILVLVLGVLGGCSSSPSTTAAPATTTTAPPASTSAAPKTTAPASSAPATSAPATSAAPSTTTAATGKPITIVFSEFESTGSFWDTEVEKPYFAEVEKRTNGRVKFEAHYNGELVGLFDVYDAVLKGTVDMAHMLPSMMADKFPMDGVMIFQQVDTKTYRPSTAWLDLYNEFPEMQKPWADTPLMGFASTPCYGTATTKKLITKWEDCKGLKFPGAGPAPESRLKAVGIVPTSVPPSDSYMALKTGTLDGLAITLKSLEDFKWLDVIKNISLVDINGSPWAFAMSKKMYNSLPADIQKVFTDMIPWLTAKVDEAANKMDNYSLTTFPQKYGTVFTNLTPAELDRWKSVDAPTLDAYVSSAVTAKGLPGDKLKGEFLRLMTKYADPQYAFKF